MHELRAMLSFISLMIVISVFPFCDEDDPSSGTTTNTNLCWELVGSPIQGQNIFETKFYTFNNIQYVFWYEYEDTDSRTYHIKSAYYNGSDWVSMGLIESVSNANFSLYPYSHGIDVIYYDGKLFVTGITRGERSTEETIYDAIFSNYVYTKVWNKGTWKEIEKYVTFTTEPHIPLPPRFFVYNDELCYFYQTGFSFNDYTDLELYEKLNKAVVKKYVKDSTGKIYFENYIKIDKKNIVENIMQTDINIIFEAVKMISDKLIMICSTSSSNEPHIKYFLIYDNYVWKLIDKYEISNNTNDYTSLGSYFYTQLFEWYFAKDYIYYLFPTENESLNYPEKYSYNLLQVKISDNNIFTSTIDFSYNSIKDYINYDFENSKLYELGQDYSSSSQIPPYCLYCNDSSCFITARYTEKESYFCANCCENSSSSHVLYYTFSFPQKEGVSLSDFTIYPPKDGYLQSNFNIKACSYDGDFTPYISYISTDNYKYSYYSNKEEQEKEVIEKADQDTCDMSVHNILNKSYYEFVDFSRSINILKYSSNPECKEEYAVY